VKSIKVLRAKLHTILETTLRFLHIRRFPSWLELRVSPFNTRKPEPSPRAEIFIFLSLLAIHAVFLSVLTTFMTVLW
jgi:hypothetical protein